MRRKKGSKNLAVQRRREHYRQHFSRGETATHFLPIPIKPKVGVTLPFRSVPKRSYVSRETPATPPSRRLFGYSYDVDRRSLCRARLKRADAVRRSNFFRAKWSGRSGSSPAHNRKHNRSC